MSYKPLLIHVIIILVSINLHAQSDIKLKMPWGLGVGINIDNSISPLNRFNFEEYKWATHFAETGISQRFQTEWEFFLYKKMRGTGTIGLGVGKQNSRIDFDFSQDLRTQIRHRVFWLTNTDIARSINYSASNLSLRYSKDLKSRLRIGLTLSLRRIHSEIVVGDPSRNKVFNASSWHNGKPAQILDLRTTLTSNDELLMSLLAQEESMRLNASSVQERRNFNFELLPNVMLEYQLSQFIYCRLGFNFKFWKDVDIYNFQMHGQGQVFDEYFEDETLIYELNINNRVVHPKIGIGIRI